MTTWCELQEHALTLDLLAREREAETARLRDTYLVLQGQARELEAQARERSQQAAQAAEQLKAMANQGGILAWQAHELRARAATLKEAEKQEVIKEIRAALARHGLTPLDVSPWPADIRAARRKKQAARPPSSKPRLPPPKIAVMATNLVLPRN